MVASVTAVAGVHSVDGVPAVVRVSAFAGLPVAILIFMHAVFLHDILSSYQYDLKIAKLFFLNASAD